jgi:Sgf11 (transcriptional regulation protein)
MSDQPNKDSDSKPSGGMNNDRQPPQAAIVGKVVLDLVYAKLVSSLSIDVAARLHRLMKTGVYPSSEVFLPKSRREIFPDLYATDDDAKAAETKYSVYVPERRKRRRLADPPEELPYEIYVRETSTAANTRGFQKQNTRDESADAGDGSEPVEKERHNNPTTTGQAHVGKKPPAWVTLAAASQPHVTAAISTTDPTPAATTGDNQLPHLTSASPLLLLPPSAEPASQSLLTLQQQQQQQHLDIWGNCHPKEPKDMVDCLICGRQVNTLRFSPHLDKWYVPVLSGMRTMKSGAACR